MQGYKTVAIDFDVGLRNLDLVMGCERRVVYDFVNVIRNEAKLQQALIRDKRVENLYVLPASQTRDKDALDAEGVGRVIDELKEMGFEYIICDSPAGIEKGAQMAMYFADEAIVVTNPEVSSVRDSDRVLGLLAAKTSRAELGGDADQDATCCSPATRRRMVKRGEMLSVDDVLELLGIPLLGVIPESKAVLQSSNKGAPAILDETTDVAQAYLDVVYRFLGEDRAAPVHRGGEAQLLRPPVRLTQPGGHTMSFLRLLPEALRRRRRWPRIACRSSWRASAPAPGGGADYLPQLQQELLAVIARYEKIDLPNVTVNLDRTAAARSWSSTSPCPSAAARPAGSPRPSFDADPS